MSKERVPVPVLTREEWSEREATHQKLVDEYTAGYLHRRATGRKHPVEDFLFTYYNLRPGRLRIWHPGAGIALLEPTPQLLTRKGYIAQETASGPAAALDVDAFLTRHSETIQRLRDLLMATADRTPRFSCFGLHEWAMVYRATGEQIRHQGYPLRLGAAGTDAVVESRELVCTHLDAFRFFTEPARPRNERQLTRADQLRDEQPGCVHATMDLYKAAFRLGPAISGELLLEAFELARAARTLDMQASPYDLTDLGVQPIRIETPDGRAEYVRRQRELSEQGQALRARLIAAIDQMSRAIQP